jgi:hypothetical protein
MIWVDRRLAYRGATRMRLRCSPRAYRRIEQPAHMYRHRGHRYITTRQFDRAIAIREGGHADQGHA